jgi:hypothetical protein
MAGFGDDVVVSARASAAALPPCRHKRDVAVELGRENMFHRTPVGVYFGRPSFEADDPTSAAQGHDALGASLAGTANNGRGHTVKNKLTTNYSTWRNGSVPTSTS